MRKLFLIAVCAMTLAAAGQNMQVQNMVNYLRSKEYEKAKNAADLAAEHESTKGSAKMWMYRGNVYKAISDTSARDQIDPEAEEKALDAYIHCLTIDKGKDIYKDEVKGNLVRSAGAVRNKANAYKVNKEYDKAIRCFDLLEQAIPFDFDGGIKRANITKEKMVFEKYDTYVLAGNYDKAKEYAGKLMEMHYKDPKVYTYMMNLSLTRKDTAAALDYIEKGKQMFEDNMDLITTELGIYMARKKSDVLRDRLIKAIEVTPDNEMLHFSLANIYKGTNKTEEAEKEYLKALELRPDYEPANYNLGVLYYMEGKDYNDKLGSLKPNDPKIPGYEKNMNDNFAKAVKYLEASYDATKDASTKKVLRQLYIRLGQMDKANQFK